MKIWMIACSTGMKNSSFIREYFQKPICTDARGTVLKYSLTHWDHINRAISELIENDMRRLAEWVAWNSKEEILTILHDTYNSAEMFTETGYLSTLAIIPKNVD